jgi:hypothetical protein
MAELMVQVNMKISDLIKQMEVSDMEDMDIIKISLLLELLPVAVVATTEVVMVYTQEIVGLAEEAVPLSFQVTQDATQ